jgi:predicted nuclease of predicted toxin-antitoxin system
MMSFQLASIGLARATDEDILVKAQELERILVTRDRDFGNLVFVRALGAGVLYLRIRHSSLSIVHSQLRTVLATYAEEELARAFVVVDAAGHRIRRLPRP